MKTVGFLISHKNNEKRRALLPTDLPKIKNKKYIFLEKGYGELLGISDKEYKGVKFLDRSEILKCDILIDVKLGDADYLDDISKGKILCGWAHSVQNIPFTTKCCQKRHTVIAWENINKDDRYIFYRNREIAGEAAVLQGLRYCEKLPYELKVAVIGNGQVAKGAIRILNGLGATVDVFNRRMENSFKKNMFHYDVLVNCVLWDTNRTDRLIYKSDLSKMKKGTLIMDISCDPYLEIETSHPTTIDNPVYTVDGVIHYAVDNTPAMFSKSVSRVLSNNFAGYIDGLIEDKYPPEIEQAIDIKNGRIINQKIIDFRKLKGIKWNYFQRQRTE